MWTVELAQPERMGELMTVPSRFLVDRRVLVRGGEIVGEEVVEEPYNKDYDGFAGETLSDWPGVFNVSTWAMFLARTVGGELVGGAVVAAGDKSVDLLEGRDDLAHVFDIRVHPAHQGRGLGRRLWQDAVSWCIARRITELRVETQDVNVGACRFYQAMGCHLHRADRHAYPADLGEILLIWSVKIG